MHDKNRTVFCTNEKKEENRVQLSNKNIISIYEWFIGGSFVKKQAYTSKYVVQTLSCIGWNTCLFVYLNWFQLFQRIKRNFVYFGILFSICTILFFNPLTNIKINSRRTKTIKNKNIRQESWRQNSFLRTVLINRLHAHSYKKSYFDSNRNVPKKLQSFRKLKIAIRLVLIFSKRPKPKYMYHQSEKY